MDIRISRHEDESKFEYIKRLVDGIANKTYDITYQDFFLMAFGVELSPTESRKRYYGIKMLLQEFNDEQLLAIEELDILQEIENRKEELYKVKVKSSDQKRENSNILRRIARAEHIIETMEEAILENLNLELPLFIDKDISFKNKGNREGVALFSDWHFGLTTKSHWNEFNTEVFYKRIEKLTGKIIEYGKQQEIKTLHVFLLGDLINGAIHVTTRISNEEDVVSQTMIVSEILANMLCEFAKHFEEVKVHNTLDNHSRVTANKKDNLEVENFARLISWYLKPRLVNIPSIEIMENKYDLGIITTKVCDFNVFGVHGHLDSVNKVVQDLTLMTKEFADYVFMAHYHHNKSDEVHGVEVIVNPTLSGVDDYAKEIRRTSKPAQKFLIFEEDEGLISTYSIRLDKIKG